MGSRRGRGARRSEPGVTLEEVHCEGEITPDDLGRVKELLTRWALKHGQAVMEKAGLDPDNRVTLYGIQGYGGNDGSN